jgi:hypothetical protein
MGDQDVFDQAVAAFGTWTRTKPLDPLVTTTGSFGRTVKGPNRNPTYRYFFRGDLYLDARKRDDGTYEVLGGTALRALDDRQRKAEEKAAAPPKTITVGGRSYTWDADREEYAESPGVVQPAPKMPGAVEPKIHVINGRPYTLETVPNYPGDLQGRTRFVPVPGVPEQAGSASVDRVTVGGRIYERDASGNYVLKLDTREPRDAQAEALAIRKAERELMDKRMLAIQGHAELVHQVHGMWERGEIDPRTAASYITASRAATEAALQGTTPYAIAQDKRQAELERQKMGRDILDQRLASGTSLASSLLSSATNLAGKAIFRPGQTSLGVDPLASLMPTLDQLQGGGDVTPYARGLLMGAGAPQGPTGPVIGTTASGVPVYDPGVSGLSGGLPPAGSTLHLPPGLPAGL